ncbi:MAG TPA: hypothetical protein VIN40_10730 [Candidatus Tyrphobacter sp.]
MKRISVALTALVALGPGAALPAAAQGMNDLVPPKIIKMGTHTSPVSGNGTVRVQVQINPNGTHVVTRIISSTNHRDDAAAKEIAASSTYRVATRGGHAIPYFYDPIFRFSGSSVSNLQASEPSTPGGGSVTTRVEALIRAGQYDSAKSAAQSALATSPNNPHLLQLLGVADYYAKDYVDAADAFDRSGSVPRLYAAVAAQSYAAAAVHLADSDSTRSLAYAQKALALDRGANSRFALGVAELGAKQYAAAIETLKGVHTTIFADPHTDLQTRYGVDQRLLEAYVGSGDLTGAQPTIEEMRHLEPSNAYPLQAVGQIYITQGIAAATAKNYEQALALFDRAAALGDPKVSAMAYDRAANVIAQETRPDPVRLKAYADKALALDANDPVANFFEGAALFEQYNASHDARLKAQALTYLNKADTLAKAAGNQALAQNIETLIRQVNAPAGGGTP